MNKIELFKTILLVITAIILGLAIGFVGVANSTEITFENCEPGTWIGGVKWVWGENGRGVYKGATYVDVPELELKGIGSLKVDLESGDYAITHYRPRMQVQDSAGNIFMLPSKVLDFLEIEVGNAPKTYYFGCE